MGRPLRRDGPARGAWTVLAVVELALPEAEPTTFWFGYVLVTTTALGTAAIAAGGAYRLVLGRVEAPS